MNKMMTKASLLAIGLIVLIPLGLMAQDEGFYPYSFARLSYVSGSVYVQRTADLGYEKGEVNLALVQGDKLGTESGQAEIHFGRRNYLRLGDNTKVEFAILPRKGRSASRSISRKAAPISGWPSSPSTRASRSTPPTRRSTSSKRVSTGSTSSSSAKPWPSSVRAAWKPRPRTAPSSSMPRRP